MTEQGSRYYQQWKEQALRHAAATQQDEPAPHQGRARRLHAVTCTTETCDASCPEAPPVRYRPDTGQWEQLTPRGRWWPLAPVSKWDLPYDPELHDDP